MTFKGPFQAKLFYDSVNKTGLAQKQSPAPAQGDLACRHLQNMLIRAIQRNAEFIQQARCSKVRTAFPPLCNGREQLFSWCPPASYRVPFLPSLVSSRIFSATRGTALHHDCPWLAHHQFFALTCSGGWAA